ncbi:hypothetical protein [Streptomyces sp. URMC 129]|uniref:hypothetical protein n=1 Tax=Streptomyces sp. URMC 129 TaxID=3423407 RepID=UPI003F1C7C8D
MAGAARTIDDLVPDLAVPPRTASRPVPHPDGPALTRMPEGTSAREVPLTSEPPLGDLTPLTAEQPLAVQPPLTAEPNGRGGAEAGEV